MSTDLGRNTHDQPSTGDPAQPAASSGHRRREHPALEAPVGGAHVDARGVTDKVVFGVTASLALGFIVWGR